MTAVIADAISQMHLEFVQSHPSSTHLYRLSNLDPSTHHDCPYYKRGEGIGDWELAHPCWTAK